MTYRYVSLVVTRAERNVLFWLEACRSLCSSFPTLPFDQLIRVLLSQSSVLLHAQHSRGESR